MSFDVDYSIFKEVWEAEYTMTMQLRRNVQKWSDKDAIIDPEREETLTFEKWNEFSNRFANALIGSGVKRYDRVMGNFFNTFEWFIAWMGSAKARCVFPSLNFMLPEGQLCKLIDDSEPAVFIYDGELKGVSLKAIELAEKKPRVCIMCGRG
ncbi:MAG: AMP-binding protein, partial [Thermodesulfobacteriota bacterium]|nr:AMP-binding protein [Thermodesulfobacteriota bacterium]